MAAITFPDNFVHNIFYKYPIEFVLFLLDYKLKEL